MTSLHRRVEALRYTGIPGIPAGTSQPPPSGERAVLGLHYHAEIPCEVRLAIQFGPPPWVFDRTLLKAACMVIGGTWGDGDVVVGTIGTGSLCFRLVAPDRQVTYLACKTAEVRAFICDSERIVPPEKETYDVDQWVAGLLGGPQ
jgi:hypothetical protein